MTPHASEETVACFQGQAGRRFPYNCWLSFSAYHFQYDITHMTFQANLHSEEVKQLEAFLKQRSKEVDDEIEGISEFHSLGDCYCFVLHANSYRQFMTFSCVQISRVASRSTKSNYPKKSTPLPPRYYRQTITTITLFFFLSF